MRKCSFVIGTKKPHDKTLFCHWAKTHDSRWIVSFIFLRQHLPWLRVTTNKIQFSWNYTSHDVQIEIYPQVEKFLFDLYFGLSRKYPTMVAPSKVAILSFNFNVCIHEPSKWVILFFLRGCPTPNFILRHKALLCHVNCHLIFTSNNIFWALSKLRRVFVAIVVKMLI